MTQDQIKMAWNKALIVDGFNADAIRKDASGAWIVFSMYGNRDSIYGWEIDHVYPLSLGGKDDDFNLRAMQWENNVCKGDDYPSYSVCIQSEGVKNIRKFDNYTVNETLQQIIKNSYID